MAELSSVLLFGLCTLLAFSFVESIHPVPVFLWSKNSSHLNGASPVLAGHTIKEEDFQESYLSKLFKLPQAICVFLQDRLSVDDISLYGDAYSTGSHGAAFLNLKVALESANSSVVLPSVEISSSGGERNELVKMFRKMADGIVVELDQEELDTFHIDNYTVDKMKTNVFVFHLHETPPSTPVAVFTKNGTVKEFFQTDELIGGVTGQIAATGLAYSCIFTSVLPSKAVYEKQLSEEVSGMSHDRLKRDLADSEQLDDSQTPENGTVFIDGNCTLMYFKELTFMFTNVSFSVSPQNNTGLKYLVTPECESNSTRGIDVAFEGIPSVKRFTLRMTFNTSGSGEWRCASTIADVSATLDNTVSVDGKFLFSCDQQPLVPSEYSYHCSKMTLKGSVNETSLIFSQFQVQPYVVKIGSFSYAYDCVGFFTIPIFMGLLTVGILLVILFIGVLALFSLTTMDRFDDPKGPGIQVASG